MSAPGQPKKHEDSLAPPNARAPRVAESRALDVRVFGATIAALLLLTRRSPLRSWFDIVSVPQDNRQLQTKAIASLCAYTHLATRFIPLVRDADAWRLLHGDELTYPSGTLETCVPTWMPPALLSHCLSRRYCKRGWCRLEMLAALAPKRFITGGWRLGSVNLRFRMHHDPEDPGTGLLLCADHILNPLTGLYTVAPDTSAVAPLVVALANRYAEYENSGSTEWDRTLDVCSRPEWLRRASTVPAEQRRATRLSGEDDRVEGETTEARVANEEKLVWTALNAEALDPVVPPAAHDGGLCGGSLLCDHSTIDEISVEV